jgi:hypothetical protein
VCAGPGSCGIGSWRGSRPERDRGRRSVPRAGGPDRAGVAGRYGFVLGGGLALILHGALQRPTEDIDLFGPESASVPAAAAEVRAALGEAGIRTAEVRHDSELDEVIEGRTSDAAFARYGLDASQVGVLRSRFSGWPR